MPQTPNRKLAYNRDRLRQQRQTETAKSPTHGSSEVPYRDQFGDQVLARAIHEDQGNEHYWGWVSLSAPDTRTCIAFEFTPGRVIGGCGMVKAWEGKLLDGSTLAQVIADSPDFKEIRDKMPVTAKRDQR